MNEVYLCLGGNLGNREENLFHAKELIQATAGKIGKESDMYETAAWGNTDQPDYLNQVIKIQTVFAPDVLMNHLLEIEKQMGRTREGEKWAARLIDIDILLYNDIIFQTDRVSIPHPRLHLRKFVLIPLAEIAKDLTHPVIKQTMAELLNNCTDESVVRKFQSQISLK